MSEKQIVVVVTKTIAVSEPDDSRYCVEFHHRAAGSWLVSWTQHLWSTSPRQAAIKASASVGGAAPNTEFYYNGEKVYETAEPAVATAYTPEYRALERRLEEAQEEASKLRKSEKLWVQLCDRGQKFFAWAQSKDLGLWGDSHFDTVPAAYEKLEKERDEYKKLWEQAGEVPSCAQEEIARLKAALSHTELDKDALRRALTETRDALVQNTLTREDIGQPLQVKTCTLNSKTNRVIVQLRRADNNQWIYSTEHLARLDDALMRAIEEARSRGYVIVGETSDRSTYGDASLIREHRENKRQLDIYMNELASLKVKLRDLSK